MKALLVFAHPDDETFSVSGTIIKLIKKGWSVKLVMATRGEAGMMGTPPLATRRTLGKVREQELKDAAKITGISEIFFLDYIDGTLHKIKTSELVSKIDPILKEEKPDIVITFEKNGITNHPDHKAISKAATEAFTKYMNNSQKHVRLYHVCLPQTIVKKYEKAGFVYDAFGKMKGTPDDQVTTSIEIEDVYEIKEKAMNVHKTQQGDWEKALIKAEEKVGRFEYFQLIAENYIQ